MNLQRYNENSEIFESQLILNLDIILLLEKL